MDYAINITNRKSRAFVIRKHEITLFSAAI